MLYDNAQLLALLSEAWASTSNPLFAARAAETVGWLEREMLVEDAFASSLDADSEGEEGKYYVWDAAAIDRLLGADAAAFRLAYGVTDSGNWEGRTVLNRLHQPGLLAPDEEARLRASADVLLAARSERVPPGRDDKVLADWNGLMIAALARASAVFDRPDWLERARRAFAFITTQMMTDDRLAHSWRAGRHARSRLPRGLREHGERGADPVRAHRGARLSPPGRALDPAPRCRLPRPRARRLLPGAGRTRRTSWSGPRTRKTARRRPATARCSRCSRASTCITGERRYRERAERLLAAFSGEAARNPTVHAALLSGTLLLDQPVQIVVIGAPADPACEALRRVALTAPLPAAVTLTLAPGEALPEGHPAAGKAQIDGRPTAYVCLGQTCRLPVTDPDELAAALAPASLLQAL